MDTRNVLGKRSLSIDLSSTSRKSARIEAQGTENFIDTRKENLCANVDIAIESDKALKPDKVIVEKTLKRLGSEEIDRLQREKAIKVLGFQEYKSPDRGSTLFTPNADLCGSNNRDSSLESDDLASTVQNHMESDLRIILNRMGGEELVLSFDRRLEQLSSEVIEGRVLPTKDWSRLLADENLTAATKAELIDQMGDTAGLSSDVVLSSVRGGMAVPETFDNRNYSLGHFRRTPRRHSSIDLHIETDSLFNVYFCPEVYGLERGFPQALNNTLQTLQKCPSKLFVASLSFHGAQLSGGSELILALADGEVVTTYRRQQCWNGTGLIEACCLYQTLRCATPYELGISPFILDSAKVVSATLFDVGILSRLSNNGASTLQHWSDLIRLQPTPISDSVSDNFEHATLLYRFESQATSSATILKISRQEKFSHEQSVNARLHATPTSPLPAHLGAPDDYFPSFKFGLSLERLSSQVDQGTLDSLSVKRGAKIIPRHLEILVTSTPTEGILWWDAFKQAKTKPVDLFNTVITVISAIEFAFHKGVMHCDICSDNILFCPADKTARLLNFSRAEIVGEIRERYEGDLRTMSINRLRSRSKYKDSRIIHSPLDDIESTVYSFLYMILEITSRTILYTGDALGDMTAKLEDWALGWERCKWNTRESALDEDEKIQSARAHIWDIDKGTIQLVTRYFQRYFSSHELTEVLEQRSTPSFTTDSNFPSLLRGMTDRIISNFTSTRKSLNMLDKSFSEMGHQSSREQLWGFGHTMEAIKDWIHVVAGPEGASGLLKALDGISQWRIEAEFQDLWGRPRCRNTQENHHEVESHAAKVERKCEELRFIFLKLQETTHPFLEDMWDIEETFFRDGRNY